MLISFLNIGVMVLLVNLKVKHEINFPIFRGRYEEFTVEWYRLVGSSLCVQLALLIVSTHAFNFGFWLMAIV